MSLCGNGLTKQQNFDWLKLKAFADDNLNLSQKLINVFALGRVENIVGKGENSGLTAFSPFPTMFLKVLHTMVIKSQDCVKKS